MLLFITSSGDFRVILFPNAWFDFLNMSRPNYPQLWQCIGMIVGVYGIGYGIASFAGSSLAYCACRTAGQSLWAHRLLGGCMEWRTAMELGLVAADE